MCHSRVTLVTVVLCITILLHGHARAESPQVTIIPDPDSGETRYAAVDRSSDEISITVSRGTVDPGYLRLRSSSKEPLETQVVLLSRILDEAFVREDPHAVRTLFLGRLMLAFGADTTLSQRLVRAAAASRLWDAERGRARGLHENAAVERIMEDAMVYRELRVLFRRYGLHLRVASVEKVLVGRPGDMPQGTELVKQGVRPTSRLPYDAMTWLKVSSMDRDTPLGGGYWKTDTMVYWRWRSRPFTPPGRVVKYDFREIRGADPATFRFLAERIEGVWGRDRKGIYFFEQPIEGADATTWQPLDWGYSKDRRAVYQGAKRLPGTDPKTFQVPQP